MAEKMILVVEDFPADRDLISDILIDEFGPLGYQVVTANDGAEGLAVALRVAPSLIIMDLRLPVIDGLELSHRLRQDPTTRNIPIIATSVSKKLELAIAGRCNDYVKKPFDLEEFLAKVRPWLLPTTPLSSAESKPAD